MPIGENIKRLRIMHGLSQKELARIAGVSDKAVSTWESGSKEPRMGAVQKIADHFGLKKSNLIEDNGLEISITPAQSPAASDDLPDVSPTGQKIDARTRRQLEKVLEDDNLTYNGVVLNEEDREKVKKALELAFWDIKELNKRKKD
ncbi:helix-turn-helix transcriptional regulator [uncultured Selenomonas sp.]|uniref:helix-turn-helix transcriptional regulator n=1 Tax=uncultured Selenomonas sp. TaxID=159275 RepID=UPI0028DC98AE|nr:helix-turn-helix transcriptional regulator [uncultured Selenomonas sp.]